MLAEQKLTQVPEMDGGVTFAKRHILSASRWIPLEQVPNKDVLLRAGSITGKARDGQLVVQLAFEEVHHIRVPRYLPLNFVSRFMVVLDVTKNMVFDRISFQDQVILRDQRQSDAWEAFSRADCGVLNIACGGGKTCLALKKIAQRGFPAIVLINSESLVEQWIDRAKVFLGLAPEQIGIVQGDKQDWDKPLVLAMIQTVASRRADIPMKVLQRYGTIIFEECHHTAAATFIKTADLFFGARFGLTATTKRVDKLEGAYLAHLGPVIYSDESSEIYAEVHFKETGCSLPPTAKITDAQELLIISKLYRKLAENKARNQLIVADATEALAAGRKVLVLSHSVNHVKNLALLLTKANPTKKVGCVHGAITGNKRLALLAESDLTVATFSLAKEGLDVPTLDTLLLTTPFRDWGAFQQCKGRIERAHPLKKTPIVVVYEDVDIPVCHAFWRTIRRGLKEHGLTWKGGTPRTTKRLT